MTRNLSSVQFRPVANPERSAAPKKSVSPDDVVRESERIVRERKYLLEEK